MTLSSCCDAFFFRCLSHDDSKVSSSIKSVKDIKANFALIELIELIASDPDHLIIDDRAQDPPCAECTATSVWYCKNDDACFCDAHKVSQHQSKSQSSHVIVPIAERHAHIIPKCDTHKTKDLDMWCHKCQQLTCEMCARWDTR